ncbi:bifunctional diguanylate cyclase/phosphodiesterase [Eubacteriaceae bacterium ES3]|nr:bifunctional diguanylate cyclase/phosphodiesterase [Eubacteriaceae bacterium ES3]
MKKTMSLRRQLNIILTMIVVFQSIALIFTLTVLQVFDMLDAEAIRVFTSTTTTRAQAINDSQAKVIESFTQEAVILNDRILLTSAQYGIEPGRIYLDNEIYDEVALEAGEALTAVLQESKVTGAFMILNGSNAKKESESAHSAVYLRNLTPEVEGASNYQLNIGPIEIAKNYQIPTSTQWNLDMVIKAGNEAYSYYENPLQAAQNYHGSELHRFGYWSPLRDILGDNQQVICYTLPLLDQAGNGYGVVGFEIEQDYFSSHYLSEVEIPYQDGFYLIASVKDNRLNLNNFITGDVIAKVYLKNEENLDLKALNKEGLYEAMMPNRYKVDLSVQPLSLYSDYSPFADEQWSLVGVVPEAVLRENSATIRGKLIYTFISTTLLSLTAVFVAMFVFTRKISTLSDYVKSLSPYDEVSFKPTGMREIDELTAAITVFSQSLSNVSKTTSKILELSLLPIGGYEIMENSRNVILTDFLYWILHLDPGTMISKAEWENCYLRLTNEKVAEQDGVYRYYDSYEKRDYWLRIIEAKSPSGVVGVVMDVTSEMEEKNRLVSELDIDALTALLSAKALRREAGKRILHHPDAIGAMVFIDLDNLKYINDNFGHEMGDRLIIQASEIFRYFEKYGGIVSRISGDEFAVYLHGFSSQEPLRKMIRNLHPYSESFTLRMPTGEESRIRFSAGVAWYPQDGQDPEALLKRADFAMYEAKTKEKGKLYEFDPEYYQQMSYLLENREAINRLLDEELIRFAFQPIVDLKSGDVVAYEALMRPLLDNFKGPQEILSVASAQSKLMQLERLVVFKAFQTIEDNIKEIGERKIFINSIPNQILRDEDHQVLKKNYQKYFRQVVIEIIEKESTDETNLKVKVEAIRDFGMQIAVDDFGNGYSNELRVLNLMPDIIKIDMEMIQGIHKNVDQRNLVTNLVSFCHKKGVRVVAEGIEESADLKTVIDLEIDYAQGYYLAMPAFEISDIPKEIKDEIVLRENTRKQK